MFVGPSLKDAIAAFTEFQQIMNGRYEKLLASKRRKITRGDSDEVYLVVIDEYAYYSATVGIKKDREDFAALARDLIARGRAAGVILILATQRPSHQIIDPYSGTCSPTGWRSAAPPTPPPTWCLGRAGPVGLHRRIHRALRRRVACCWPKPATPAGSTPHSSPTTHVHHLAARAAQLRRKDTPHAA